MFPLVMDRDLVLCLVLFGCFFLTLFYIYFRAQQKIKLNEALNCCETSLLEHHWTFCRQEGNDVWNISGRVNSQNGNQDNSTESYPPEYQAKDPRFAPPPYTEVDLPTYEEAITAAAAAAGQKEATTSGGGTSGAQHVQIRVEEV